MTRSFAKSVALAMLVAMLGGCASVSKPSLVGTWKRPGPIPGAVYGDEMKIVALTFGSDGKLDFTWVPAYCIDCSRIFNSHPEPKTSHDTYSDLGSSVRIISGSNSNDFPYEIKDGKLFIASSPKSPFGDAGARQILERQ